MERREVLLGGGALAAGILAGDAFAMQGDHHTHTTTNQSLVTAASNCVSTGEICMNHCHEVALKGDTSLVQCARSVNELIAACAALQALTAQNSSFVPRYAKLTADVCKSSEAECRKFEKNHVECKTCADACVACIAECAKVA